MTNFPRSRKPGSGKESTEEAAFRRLPNFLTRASQIALLIFTIACGILAVKWMLADVTGEYLGQDPKLGNISLSLIRRAANLEGAFTYGDGTSLPVASGKIKGNEISLSLSSPDKGRKANFLGTMEEQVFHGTLSEKGGGTYKLSLRRDALASMYRQVQEHLPHWPVKI